MDRTITVPGWVWLLVIAVLSAFAAWRMVKKIGIKELLVSRHSGVEEFMRLMVFLWLVGLPVICVKATLNFLVFGAS